MGGLALLDEEARISRERAEDVWPAPDRSKPSCQTLQAGRQCSCKGSSEKT